MTMDQKAKQEWQRAEPHQRPTIFQMYGSKVGMYQSVGGPDGRYAYQEDALISFILPEFKLITQKEAVILKVVENLQDIWGQERMIGSTLCGTIAWQEENEIKTCNPLVGDGMQFLVILNQGKLKAVQQLNPHLQNPSNQDEQIRLSKKGYIKNGRLAGILAVSGALGDKDFEQAGLTHIPNITFENFTLDQGDLAFIVVTTDGLLEADFDEYMVGQFISENWNKSPELIAKKIVDEAIKTSTDNVSIGVFPVGRTPTGVFVFDGHGGPKVAHNLANHFYEEFKRSVDLFLNANN